MKLSKLSLIGLGIALSISSVAAAEASPIKSKAELKAAANAKVKHTTAKELKALKDSGSVMLLLDIRTEAEFLAGHIEGALWVPRGKLEFSILKLTKDPNARIILCCRTGSRSALGALSLQEMGYKNVSTLDGGFAGWSEDEGFPFFNFHGKMKMLDYEKKENLGIRPPAPKE